MGDSRRAMFANEAGLGTAPIAFSAVKTSKPVAQAFIAMLQPFVDTVIVGSATAFIIVVTGAYLNTTGIEGIELTSKAFASVCPFFPILLTFMASCFVLSTMLLRFVLRNKKLDIFVWRIQIYYKNFSDNILFIYNNRLCNEP